MPLYWLFYVAVGGTIVNKTDHDHKRPLSAQLHQYSWLSLVLLFSSPCTLLQFPRWQYCTFIDVWMLCSSSSLNRLSSSLPPSLSLALTHRSGEEGPAPPSDDIRGLEIAAALKLPVMGACCEACNPGQPLTAEGEEQVQEGRRDGRGRKNKVTEEIMKCREQQVKGGH